MFGLFRTASRRSIKKFYATRDGASTHDYQFEFREVSGGNWRAYIVRQPSYRGRDDNCHVTHRLSDSHGRYVCWDHALRSLEEAKQVAAAWAEATQRYIRTGERF